jgi:hypothetical protein
MFMHEAAEVQVNGFGDYNEWIYSFRPVGGQVLNYENIYALSKKGGT